MSKRLTPVSHLSRRCDAVGGQGAAAPAVQRSGSLTKPTLLRPALDASASVWATVR